MTRSSLIRIGSLLTILSAHTFTRVHAAIRPDAERGVVLYRDGQYAEARYAFEKAVEQDPADFRAWQDLGWTLCKLGQTNEAIRVWRDILATTPSFLRAHNAMGEVLQQRGEMRMAALHYARSLELRPDQTNLRMRLGECLEAIGYIYFADLAYRCVLRREPGNEAAVLHLARVLGLRKKPAEAARLLRGFAATQPECSAAVDHALARTEAERGTEAYRAGRFTEAARLLGTACELHPDKPRYAVDRGWALRRAGQTGAALEAWECAARLEPLDPGSLHLAMAEAAHELKRPEQARLHYKTALTMRGKDPQVLYRYALMELNEGHVEAALSLVERMLGSLDLDATWGSRLANDLIGRGVTEAAIRLFEQKNGTDPTAAVTAGLAVLHHSAGVEAYRQDRLQDAIASFRRALAVAPTSRAVLRDLGWAYWREGDMSACGRTWQELAERHPGFAVAHDLLAQYHLRLQDYDAAVDAARACLEKDPGYAAARKHLARALVDSGRPGAARNLVRALSREHPEDGSIQQLYGLALTKLLDYEAAEKQWRRVLGITPNSVIAQQNWVDALYRVGERTEALEAARRFAAGPAPPASLLELLGHDAFRNEDFEEAEKWFTRLTDLRPERPGYWLKVSDCLAGQEEHQMRPAVMQAATEIRPDRADLQLELCAALADAGKRDEALRAFEAFTAGFPDSYLGFSAHIDILRRFEHHREALRVLQGNRATFYQPHEVAFRRADLLRMVKQYGEAEALLDAVAHDKSDIVEVPILVYHGLSVHDASSDMPVSRFADQMRGLSEEGFTPLTVTELERMVRQEGALPERPVVITFDDARTDSFSLADPILDRYSMKATMFVPTARITDEDLYHASRRSLRRYAGTGRWELQSHGHEAHNWITATSEGYTGSFLGSRMWIPAEERYETGPEFGNRLRKDYCESAEQVRTLVPDKATRGYAFPYSDFGQAAQKADYALASINVEPVREVCGFGFIQRPSGYNRLRFRQPLPPLLRRFTVPYDWGGRDLLEFLAADHPRNEALLEMAKGATWEGRYETASRLYRDLKQREPVLSPRCDRALADIAVARGRAGEALSILEQGGDSPLADASIRDRLDWLTEPITVLNVGYRADSENRLLTRAGVQARLPLAGNAAMSIRGGGMFFEEEDLGDAFGFDVDCGTTFDLPSLWQMHAVAGFRRVDGTDGSFTGDLRFRRRADLHDFVAQWGYRHIDTLRAEQAEIRFHRLSGEYRFHSARWPFAARYMRWEISDGNTRTDVRCQLFYRLPAFPDWQIGGTFEYADVDFQTPDYYTPERLLAPRAAVRYDYRSGESWTAGAEAGIGAVLDEDNENRLTTRGALQIAREWSPRTRSGVSAYYSTTAGYSATRAELSIQHRF